MRKSTGDEIQVVQRRFCRLEHCFERMEHQRLGRCSRSRVGTERAAAQPPAASICDDADDSLKKSF
jgi:hypothetical protein